VFIADITFGLVTSLANTPSVKTRKTAQGGLFSRDFFMEFFYAAHGKNLLSTSELNGFRLTNRALLARPLPFSNSQPKGLACSSDNSLPLVSV